MNHTSNGMNGNSQLHPPLPLMAKSLRGSRSRKEKTGSQNDPLTALPPIEANKPPARPARAPKRAEAGRDQASEPQAIPPDVAELISFAQAYPAEAEASVMPEPAVEAAPAARSVSDAGLLADPAPELALETAEPSGALRQNFREAYRESFRKALESYRENARQQEPDEPFTPILPAPRKPRRSRFYAAPKAIGPEPTPQTVASAESAQPEESAVPMAAALSLSSRLGESVRVLLRRTAGLAAAPYRGLHSAWSWYQGRRVLQTNTRRMRVSETISLGEKRFLAVVEVDDCQFLVGGGASSVAVLAQLGTHQTARDLMNRAAGAQA